MKNIKKLFLLFFVISNSYPAQQLEKPKLSCMAKIGFPTLSDRLTIIQAERANFLMTQGKWHRQNSQAQIMAIRQLNETEKDTLLNNFASDSWADDFERISKDLTASHKIDKCLLTTSAALVAVIGVYAWATYPAPYTTYRSYYPLMHPRFYQNDPARYGG